MSGTNGAKTVLETIEILSILNFKQENYNISIKMR